MNFATTEKPAASVVVCAFNSRKRIGTALASLRLQDYLEPFEVIAVVSGTDGCGDWLRTYHPDVRVVDGGVRLYPGAARNAGVRVATGPFIAFVPDDCEATPGWLRTRAEHHGRGVPLVGGAIDNGTPRSVIGTAGYYVEYAASIPKHEILSKQTIPHTLSYSRSVFQEVGLFPETEVPGEDTLFNARCRDRGLAVEYEPRAVLRHLNITQPLAFLRHQFEHGRGAAMCSRGSKAPLNLAPRQWRDTFVRYPAWRFRRTVQLLRMASGTRLIPFALLSPWILAGYLAAAYGTWSERTSSLPQ